MVIKILNAFAGIGGNRLGFDWWAKKTGQEIKVTAVEYEPLIAEEYLDNFPDDEMVVGDAWEYIVQNYDKFDFIWASPPCPTHSRLNLLMHKKIRRLPDFRLFALITYMQFWGRKQKWVIENVIPYYNVPIKPTVILNRHNFWSNFHIPHKKLKVEDYSIIDNSLNELENIIGLNLSDRWSRSTERSKQIMRNCVLPVISEHIIKAAYEPNIIEELI